ncbi:diguanylate cyclase [Pantoea sp. FN060301]|uniref:diguanylate cyclase n=1 Tax=Pantoea sp. FN060301 TaxID=3420380 RepID=UPI003D17E672
MKTETFFSVNRAFLPWRSALTFGAITFALTLFCLKLIEISDPVSPLWFSTALMTVLIFRQPLKALPLILSACTFGNACASAWILGPEFPHLLFPLINLVQAVMGGALLRRLLDQKSPLGSLLSWSKMVITTGLCTPLAGALMASWLLTLVDRASPLLFSTWVVSEMIGMLSLGPVCLLWRGDYFRHNFNPAALSETLLTLAITLALTWFSLRFLPWPFTFVIVVLFYSAVRLPRFEAFMVFLATLTMMTLMLAMDRLNISVDAGIFSSVPWLPFLMAIIPSHMMALVMHSFRKEKRHITESETRFRHAMEYSAIGMALVSPQGQWLQVNKSLCRLLGYSEKELSQMTFQQITHPDDLEADVSQLYALLLGDIETYSMEKRYFRKDGELVRASLTVSLVRDSEQLPLYFISQIEDITDLRRTEEVNKRLMQRITLANEAGGIAVWDWNLKTGAMQWDKRMFQIYGLKPEGEATYLTWVNSMLPADRQSAIDAFDESIKTASPIDIQFRIETDQGIRYIRSQARMMLDENGEVEKMLGINQDVTAMHQLTDALYQEKERMHITLDAIGEAVISTDEEMRVIFMNPVAEEMSGWRQEDAVARPISEILRITEGSDGPEVENLLLCKLPTKKSVPDLERGLVLHNSAGERFDIHYSITPLKTQEGENIGSVMVIQDVSESREMLRHLSYSASHDMLTRLPNRVSFEHQLMTMLRSASEQGRQHVLVFLDLDRFKTVNDTAGHAAGDALLREIAVVMKSHLRHNDVLARLGGDEFGILLQDCPLENGCERVDQIIRTVIQYHFVWESGIHRIGASAGIAVIGTDNLSASEVMARADLACYRAKHSGRGQLAVYDDYPQTATPVRRTKN